MDSPYPRSVSLSPVRPVDGLPATPGMGPIHGPGIPGQHGSPDLFSSSLGPGSPELPNTGMDPASSPPGPSFTLNPDNLDGHTIAGEGGRSLELDTSDGSTLHGPPPGIQGEY